MTSPSWGATTQGRRDLWKVGHDLKGESMGGRDGIGSRNRYVFRREWVGSPVRPREDMGGSYSVGRLKVGR